VACGAAACDGTLGTLLELERQEGAGATGGGAGSSTANWRPSPGSTFHLQLTGPLDTSVDADVYVIDGENTSGGELDALKARGRALCYFSAGSWEPWRQDAAAFPDSALGAPVAGYPEERWLDVRDGTVRQNIEARIELLFGKGCDGLAPGLLASHPADSGFPLSSSDQLDYARFVAAAAHVRGMAVAYSGSDGWITALEPDFDVGLSMGCLSRGTCDAWLVFREAGKAVFLVEIGDEGDLDRVCAEAGALGFDAILTDQNLSGFRLVCP
jgi:hypothetical protein